MHKILFIGAHRLNRSPSQRFRFEKYFSFLNENGFECTLSALLDKQDDEVFYSEGNIPGKFFVILKSFFKRISDLNTISQYDIIFIQREAFMTGSAFFEKAFRKKKAKIIFDFDDAIWLPNISESNKKFEWLKNPSKTAEIIALADVVIAGNSYLADYAKKYNKNVHIIPTTINTDYHKRKYINQSDSVCIGWTGSHTTIQHFEYAVTAMKKLKEKYGNKIYFKVIGDEKYINTDLKIQGLKWDLQTEINDLSEIDIGIMPLPDDEWAKGKCGLKGLQYMALEIPCIMSPVGVNSEIIEDGKNGFLAKDETEWVEKLSRLIENPELRKQIGLAARRTVVEKYSVNSQKVKYLNLMKGLLS
ncbi:MAG TPA: glycosyltransferase family 4 protein [Bacteroidia bacterium]